MLVIFLLLYGEFRNLSLAALVMASLPLALIPLVLGGDKPDNEIQSPMSIVVLAILRDLHLLLAELNAHRL